MPDHFLRALGRNLFISQVVVVCERFLQPMGCKERKGWEKQHTQMPEGLKLAAVPELWEVVL